MFQSESHNVMNYKWFTDTIKYDGGVWKCLSSYLLGRKKEWTDRRRTETPSWSCRDRDTATGTT